MRHFFNPSANPVNLFSLKVLWWCHSKVMAVPWYRKNIISTYHSIYMVSYSK